MGGVLIFHNWVAFFPRLTEAPKGADRRVAEGATLLFALVHGWLEIAALLGRVRGPVGSF